MQIIGKYFTVDSVKIDSVPQDWTGREGLRRPTVEELEHMMDSSVKFCAQRSNKPTSDVEKLIRKSDRWANSTFRYAIAKEIRAALARNPKFRDLYIMGSVMEDRARLTSDINLILHVEDTKEDFQYWLVLLKKPNRLHSIKRCTSTIIHMGAGSARHWRPSCQKQPRCAIWRHPRHQAEDELFSTWAFFAFGAR